MPVLLALVLFLNAGQETTEIVADAGAAELSEMPSEEGASARAEAAEATAETGEQPYTPDEKTGTTENGPASVELPQLPDPASRPDADLPEPEDGLLVDDLRALDRASLSAEQVEADGAVRGLVPLPEDAVLVYAYADELVPGDDGRLVVWTTPGGATVRVRVSSVNADQRLGAEGTVQTTSDGAHKIEVARRPESRQVIVVSAAGTMANLEAHDAFGEGEVIAMADLSAAAEALAVP